MLSSAPLSVLFVCTGNICRSPTAEGVFRAQVRQSGFEQRFVIDSAGTGGWHHGEAPDPRSVKAAMTRGVDISPLRARQLRQQDYSNFDYLIALDRTHLTHMQENQPPATQGRLSLLMSYSKMTGSGSGDVPDPYYGGPDDFERVYDLIESGTQGLLDFLIQEQGMKA